MSDSLSIDQFIEQLYILESNDPSMAKQVAQDAYAQASDSFILNKYLLEVALKENDFQNISTYSSRLQGDLSGEDLRHLLLEARYKDRKEVQISCIEKIFDLNQGTIEDLKDLVGLNMDLGRPEKVESLDSLLCQHAPDQFSEAKLRIAQIVSARDYCQSNQLFYQELDQAENIQTGPNLELNYRVPDSFMACFENVRIIPPNFTVLTHDDFLIYDGLDTNSRTSMTLMPHYRAHSQQDQVLLGMPENTIHITEEAVLFGGGPNFSHDINDWMSKLYLLENFPDLHKLPVLIADTMNKTVLELMDIIGIKPQNVRIFDSTSMIEADKLWVPSLTHGFQLISPNYLNWIRDKIFNAAQKTDKKRIYIGRQNASYRKLTNENDLIALLEKYDFECIAPENLEIQEQINLFYNCDVLVTPTGGGTSAISFCPQETRVIELASPAINTPQYAIVTSLQGNPYQKLMGELTGNNSGNLTFDEDFRVNLDELETVLTNL